jgi:hypothetical protein
MLIGATELPRFLESCAIELAAPWLAHCRAIADVANEDGARLPRPWLVARNLLFCELATRWVGYGGLRPFFDALLHPDRFRDLQPVGPD